MIPQSFISDLQARLDIVEVVGRFVQLKKAGANYQGLCPFHGEKSPSFTVSPIKQFYHCFGCGAHGTVIGFLMEHQSLSYVDSIKELARQIGVTVPEEQGSGVEQKRVTPDVLESLALASKFYRGRLKESDRAIDYLKRRGLSGQTAARFGLGYAPGGWRPLEAAVPDYLASSMVEAGLVISRDESSDEVNDDIGKETKVDTGHERRDDWAGEAGNEAIDVASVATSDESPFERKLKSPVVSTPSKRYDRFRDRIMFPIRNPRGQVIGFGGRVLDQGEPKYLNSPETPVFVKGRELYGLFEAREALRREDCAIVVEGYMDVVMLAQYGVDNALATLGTATTPEHLKKLLRQVDRVVFSFDGDNAGRKAAWRALEASLPMTSDTQRIDFLFLPPEHDPDSYVQAYGLDGWKAALAKADSFSSFLLNKLKSECDLDEPEGRAKLLALAKPLLSKMSAQGLRLQMVHRLSDLTHISVNEVTPLVLDLPTPQRSPQSFAPRGKHSQAGGREAYKGLARRPISGVSMRSGLPEIERHLRILAAFSPKLAEDLLHEELDEETISQEMRQWLSLMESFHVQASRGDAAERIDATENNTVEKKTAGDWIASAGHELAMEALTHFVEQYGTTGQQVWGASVRQDALADYGGLASLGQAETDAEGRELLARLRKASQKLQLQRLSRSTDPADLERFKELLKSSKLVS